MTTEKLGRRHMTVYDLPGLGLSISVLLHYHEPSNDTFRMQLPSRFATMAVSVVLSISISVLGGCVGQVQPTHDGDELARVTSPNGYLDAVLMRYTYGGAAGGGVDSNVYIVRKGSPVVAKSGNEILRADPMSGGALVWKRDHLLQVQYDIAYIQAFRNLWGLHEIENAGPTGERDFEIEIQLVPKSDASALKYDGSFRRLGDR